DGEESSTSIVRVIPTPSTVNDSYRSLGVRISTGGSRRPFGTAAAPVAVGPVTGAAVGSDDACFAEGRIVGVEPLRSAEEPGGLRLVHRRADPEALHEIGVGEDHRTVRLEVGEARSHVGADLLPWPPRPIHDQRPLEARADLGQERLIALV